MIIFQLGENFWIESIDLPQITIPDAAGRESSVLLPLERPGICVGQSLSQRGGPDNDNTQAIGQFDLRKQDASQISYGDFVSAVLWRVTKQAGTAGNSNQTATCMLFMRKRVG